VQDGSVSDLPSYPSDASEREAAVPPETAAHDLAGWWPRVGAYLLDGLLLFLPLTLIFGILFALDPSDDSAAWAWLGIGYIVSIAVPFAYFTIMHGGERGQTYGKRALGIRVVDDKGGSLGYGRAFGRYALMFVFGLFFVPILLDLLWPLWDEKNQALHDKVVSSLVVRA
jgi:uncharacterized RDD family membrane protein YckC